MGRRVHLEKRVCVAALMALGVASGSASARAQTAEELAAARQVFNEGKLLEGKSAWAEALEAFKKVAVVKMTPQVRFHIALCEENLGHLLSALKGFELAAEDAKQVGAAAVEVATKAPERAERLRGRIGAVWVIPAGKLLTSKVMLDAIPLSDKDLGTPILVDPGHHVLEVRDKDGTTTYRKELTMAEKGTERVEVPSQDESPRPPAATPTAPLPLAVYLAGSLGATALAVSAVFWVLRGNTITEIASHCTDTVNYSGCDPLFLARGTELANQGRTAGVVGSVLLGVGGAGLVTAGVLAVVPRAKRPAASAPSAAGWTVAPMGTGLQIIGRF